jgi:septum formation protein
MLLALAGRAHEVFTGVALAGAGLWPEGRPTSSPAGAVPPGSATLSAVERTEVLFRPFGEAEARAYAATGEPLDKAGAYGIQGRGAVLVEGIRGDYDTVVGLPVGRLVELLGRAGWRYTFAGLEKV